MVFQNSLRGVAVDENKGHVNLNAHGIWGSPISFISKFLMRNAFVSCSSPTFSRTRILGWEDFLLILWTALVKGRRVPPLWSANSSLERRRNPPELSHRRRKAGSICLAEWKALDGLEKVFESSTLEWHHSAHRDFDKKMRAPIDFLFFFFESAIDRLEFTPVYQSKSEDSVSESVKNPSILSRKVSQINEIAQSQWSCLAFP